MITKQPVLILGGYGNFGKRIARALVTDRIPVVIAGRSRGKAEELAKQLPLAQVACFDAKRELDGELGRIRPSVVINTCGPFQGSDYGIAESCIRAGVHYIDLADGRDFVTGITALDVAAKAHGVAIISGASSVPGLSSAVVEHFKGEFSSIDSLQYGISPGQKAERGLATSQGILTYVGKPLKPSPGQNGEVYGWQDIYCQEYPELGRRWLANCDIPDLDLFPQHYGIKSIRFSAGLELKALHFGLWGLSWLVRLGVPLNLPRYAGALLKASNCFDRFGSADGGMHVILRGTDHDGASHTRQWFIVARNGHGPHIPTVPAIILARKLARGERVEAGAYACVGKVTLEEYLAELKGLDIATFE